MSEGQVKIENLTKSYDGETFAVKEASVTIEQGEFFVLVGPSGCGKSTMLRMIAGLESITAGKLLLHGSLSNDMAPNKRALSMVFQNYALYPHLTVEENILFGLKVRKISKDEQQKRCLEACEMLGMTEYLKRKPRELSGGQRQRVALARAVVSQMPICLMDEPLSNLDAKLRQQMRTEIRQLQQELGITMIYVTHDQVEAMTMGDRMMVLKDGEVKQVGRPLDIYNKPENEFVAGFIGAPPMNVTEGTVADDGRVLIDDNDALYMPHYPLDLDTVRVGVRPEHLMLESVSDEDWSIIVTVKTTEVLGNETHVSFNFGGGLWKAKIPDQHHYRNGQQAKMYIHPSAIHLFDAKTGEALFRDVTSAKNIVALKGGSV